MADDTALTELHLDSVLTALGSSQLSLMQNRGTGMGTALDPFTQVEIGHGRVLNEWQLRSLYRGSWFIRRVVEVPPDDMTKAGVELTLHDGSNSKISTAALQVYRDGGQNVNPYSRRMSCGEAFRKAMTWARLFGQAYAVMRVNGGEDPSKPLKEVKSFEGLSVLDRHALGPVIGTANPEHPEFYQIDRRDNVSGTEQTYNLGQRIHESRVLVFRGAAIHPYDIQLEGDGAYDSIVQQIYECFARHYTAKDAISKGLDSYSLFKVAISGLSTLMGATGGTETLRNYLNTVAQQMSLHRIIVQDTEASKSEFQERTFAGVEGLFQQMSEELTAAANMPHYKIWGSVGKAGLSDSGGAESRAWAEQVKAMQRREFGDNHRRLFHAIFEAVGKVPKAWEVEYPSIYTPTPEEEGAIAKTHAETLTTLVRDGLITARQGYQALATGQPLENVLEPLGDADVLTIVDEAESAGPSAEEELAALLGGGETAGAIAPGVEPPVDGAQPAPEVDPAAAPDEEAATAEDELAGLMAEDEPAIATDAADFDLATLEQQSDSADELLEVLLGWRVDAGKGKGGKKGKREKKPNCTKGRSCGMSCIPRTRQCKADLSPAADAVAKSIAGTGGGGSGGGSGGQGQPPTGQQNQQDPFAPAVNPLPRSQGSAIPAASPTPQRAAPSPPTQTANRPYVVQSRVDARRDGLKRRLTEALKFEDLDEYEAAGMPWRGTVDQMLSKAEANMARLIQDTDVMIRVPGNSVIEKIIEAERFKSQYETGTSKGVKSLTRRTHTEKEMFGYQKGLPKEQRPIYGYLGTRDADKIRSSDFIDFNDPDNQLSNGDGLDSYGTISVRLKPTVKDKTTFVSTDSLAGDVSDFDVMQPSTFGKVSAASLVSSTDPNPVTTIAAAANANTFQDLAAGVGFYMEAQIHEGVRTSDIEEIAWLRGGTPSQPIIDWANANGVKLVYGS